MKSKFNEAVNKIISEGKVQYEIYSPDGKTLVATWKGSDKNLKRFAVLGEADPKKAEKEIEDMRKEAEERKEKGITIGSSYDDLINFINHQEKSYSKKWLYYSAHGKREAAESSKRRFEKNKKLPVKGFYIVPVVVK